MFLAKENNEQLVDPKFRFVEVYVTLNKLPTANDLFIDPTSRIRNWQFSLVEQKRNQGIKELFFSIQYNQIDTQLLTKKIKTEVKTWPYYSVYGNGSNKRQIKCLWHLLLQVI